MRVKNIRLLRMVVGGVTAVGAAAIVAWQVSQQMHTAKQSVAVPSSVEITITATAVSTTVSPDGMLPSSTAAFTYTSSVTTELTTTMISTTAQAVTFPLDLNAASPAELEQLPGIGMVLAERIVAYRTAIGGFINREQLLEIEGIGEATLVDCYDYLYIENEVLLAAETQPSAQAEIFLPEEEVLMAETPVPEAPASVETFPPESTEIPILDLNTATAEEFMLLPGVDETLAQEMVSFRIKYQYYSSVYEVLYLEHMTDALFLEIRDYLQVGS